MGEETWVEMCHPKTEGTAQVTKEAYHEVWAPLGWRIAKPQEQEPVVPAETKEA